MDDGPEDVLVESARRGSREAFVALVRRHRGRVYGLIRRMVGNPVDADDLAQEVFLTAWRSIPSFKGEASFSTWLYRIAVNLTLSFLKRKGREKGRVELTERAIAGDAAAVEGDSPERDVGLHEIARRVDEAVGTLPPHLRTSFVLVVGQGMSHAQAAQVLGCPENTVSWRMHKARKLLRARLRPYLGEVRS